MQETLPPREPHLLQPCARNRYSVDLSGSSLRSSHRRAGRREHGRRASYPSPPMSGPSSPPSCGPSLPASINISSTSSTTSENALSSPQIEFPRAPQSPQSTPAPSAISEARQPLSRPRHISQSSRNAPNSHAFPNQPSPESAPPTSIPPGEQQSADSRSALQFASHSSKTAGRTKAHTPSACVNCKKAHLRCEAQRPCPRCIKFNKQSTCQDVRHKKRGRPRLREEREGMQPPNSGSRQSQAALKQSVVATPMSTITVQKPAAGEEEQAEKKRPRERASTGSGIFADSPTPSYTREPGLVLPREPIEEGPPVAYFTMDLIFIKASLSFREASGIGLENVDSLPLLDVLSPASRSKLSEVRHQLELEQFEHEKSLALPPYILEADVRRAIQAVPAKDYVTVTRSFIDHRPEELTFRTPGGQYRTVPVQAKLARTSFYFVSLLLPHSSQPTTPHIQAPSYAPSGLPPIQRRPLAPSPVFTGKYPPHHSQPLSRSSAPSSPYFSGIVSAIPSPTASRSSIHGSYHESRYPFQTGNYPNSSMPSPISILPRAAPSLPSPGSLPPRRDSMYSSSDQQPQNLGELQLPPILKRPSDKRPTPLPPPSRSSTGMDKRRSITSHGGRAEDDKEKDDGGNGRRRKRARIDVKEVMD